ncbi:MAG: hypothetical protein V1492_03650 [Candidatus Micrarchaeota archaeon]
MVRKMREAVKPLGAHTAVGFVQESQKFNEIPYLKDNEGKLPPFIIAVGSRVRVMKAPSLLNLKEPAFIDQIAKKQIGPDAYGRVSVLIGKFEQEGFSIPLCVFETQMGCSGTQINLKEALYFANETGYLLDNRAVKSNGIYVIRAGTAAGVNSKNPSEAQLQIGDITIATESYGAIGAVLQSIIGRIHFLPDMRESVEELLSTLKADKILGLSHDRTTLKTYSSTTLVLQMQQEADRMGVRNFVGPNFSKDSLYSELGEDGFAALRDTYGIISSEMEQLVVDSLAGEFRRAGVNVQSGLISALVGAIPGKSFPETTAEKEAAAKAEENAVIIAAKVLWNIARGNNPEEALVQYYAHNT